MKSICRQIKINFKYIAKSALWWTSSFIAAFQIIGFLCEFNDIFPDDWSFLSRFLMSGVAVALIWLVMFVIRSCFMLRKEVVTVVDAENGKRVYVEYGDLLEETQEPRIIVVASNRCFDTMVDNDLISENTVHGMVIRKICKDGYTQEMLSDALQRDLIENRQLEPCRILTVKEKRKGNLKRYPVGSIAEFRKKPDAKESYFFVGMSALNSSLHPQTTDQEYLMTLQTLIEYCNMRSHKLPIYMPIMGTYGRNYQKSERELLAMMVSVLRFNKHLINTDIHIVVYEGRRDEISIHGL